MTTTAALKSALLNILRIKIDKIGKGERRFIDRREENARAYAEALADANIITDGERDELYEKAHAAAFAAVRVHLAAEVPRETVHLNVESEATSPVVQGKSLYPVHLQVDQLQIVKELLEQASSRVADPESPIFCILDEVRAARRRNPIFR